jgi:hypothetical protein
LPCLLFEIEGQWHEIRVSDLETPWTWPAINAAEDARRAALPA